MTNITITLHEPTGMSHEVEIPDDVPVVELVPEIITALGLQTHGPDGARLTYQMILKRSSRRVEEPQTLAAAGVVSGDHLMLAPNIKAGSDEEHPRIVRLKQEAVTLETLDDLGSRIRHLPLIETPGMPPERYVITYNVRSIIGINETDRMPIFGNKHIVDVLLHESYPSQAPQLRCRQPIWHPNIHDTTGDICIDITFWGAARTLLSLVLMIGEMLQHKNVHYDLKTPPYPFNEDAARWYSGYLYRMGWDEPQPTDDKPLIAPSPQT
jgi:hypothetical protein